MKVHMRSIFSSLGVAIVVLAIIGCDTGSDQNQSDVERGATDTISTTTTTDDAAHETTGTTSEVDEEPATTLPNAQ
jgi:hypothetical protein